MLPVVCGKGLWLYWDLPFQSSTEADLRTTRNLILVSAAAMTLAGTASLAQAKRPDDHILTLQLPDGAVEQIRYTGDVPPQVVLTPDRMPLAMSFAADDPFARIERISAAMDRQAAAMLQAIGGMAAQPVSRPLTESRLRPSSTEEGYSIISTASGSGVCTRSMQITYSGDGQAPHVVSRTTGDCRAEGLAVPSKLPGAPAPEHDFKTIKVKAHRGSPATEPYKGLVHQISDWRR